MNFHMLGGFLRKGKSFFRAWNGRKFWGGCEFMIRFIQMF